MKKEYPNILVISIVLLTSVLGPLTGLPGFSVHMVKWCSMHCLNLGVSLWATGSALKSIIEDFDWFGDRASLTPDDLLALGYDRFKSWTKARRIQ